MNGRMAETVAALALFSFMSIFILTSANAVAADVSPQVILNASKAGPRALEDQTERTIRRDYGFAWKSLAQALDSNSVSALNGMFAGTASAWLHDTVMNQRNSGVKSRYLNQTHKLEAAFYSPEGDVIELHDTAEYNLQILDGEKPV